MDKSKEIRDDVSQLVANSSRVQSDVPQIAANSSPPKHVAVRVGSFNIGIHQNMLKHEIWKKRHERNFQRVAIKALSSGGLHLFTCCEFGGHKQGPTQTRLVERDAKKHESGANNHEQT